MFPCQEKQGKLRSRVFRGNVEADQVGGEAACANCAIDNAGHHPDGSQNDCGTAEMHPNEAADEKSKHRYKEVAQLARSAVQPIMHEACRVDSHEGDERAEIERLGSDFIGSAAEAAGKEFEKPGASQSKKTHRQDVIARDAAL